MEKVLEKIQTFADQSHGIQQRKYSPDKYIVHPVRVMETCRTYLPVLPVLAAALLHDVLEDTPVTKEEIKQFLLLLLDEETTTRTTGLVEELTDIYTRKKYPGWNRKKRRAKEAKRLSKTSAEAQTIKYADIIDNSLDLKNAEPDFARLFLFECRALLKAMNDGNDELRQIAIKTVDECIKAARKS